MSGFQGNRIYKTGNDARLVDSTGTDIGTDKNRFKTEEYNSETMEVMYEMLDQLKIMNIHLSLLTDNNISKQDIG